jgi:hypothetical protein
MPKPDELAEWQLRILQEYAKSGSPILARNFKLWFAVLTGVLVALVGVSITGQNPIGSAGFAFFAIVVAFIGVLSVERDSKKRARIIEGALRGLASGKPIPQEQFDSALGEISKLEDTEK